MQNGRTALIACALAMIGVAGCETQTTTGSVASSSGAARQALAPPPPPAGYAPSQSFDSTTMALRAPSAARPSATAPIAQPGPTAQFSNAEANGVVAVQEQPVSTFSLDVDTAAYAISRRFLTAGNRPPAQAVRPEQFINYFPYDYARPESKAEPFRIGVTVLPAPWKTGAQLLHIGVKGFEIPATERPPANLVLLVDVSGSMSPPDRLPLLQQVFRTLAGELRPIDRVSIVTYANGVSTVLTPTTGDNRATIVEAVDKLRASGGTAGSDGIQRAYALAEQHFDPRAVNRIILATDGDFNLGITDRDTLKQFVADKRKTGIYLSVFGVGLSNLNDLMMQTLAHAGNGIAAYIDSAVEARKVLVNELGSSVFPIADDAKIQVEFNPAMVAEYRLIGYETRMLKREDFKDDRVDAGEIGSGHSVTAIYEIVAPQSAARLNEPLRYQPQAIGADPRGEIAHVRLRYKLPGERDSRLMERAVTAADVKPSIGEAPEDVRFSVAVAGFAQLLRAERRVDGFGYDQVLALAEPARGRDPFGYRAEFLQLVRVAGGLRQ